MPKQQIGPLSSSRTEVSSSGRKLSRPELRSTHLQSSSASRSSSGATGDSIKENGRPEKIAMKTCDIPSSGRSSRTVNTLSNELSRGRDIDFRDARSIIGDFREIRPIEAVQQLVLEYPKEEQISFWYKYFLELEHYVRKRLERFQKAEDFYNESEGIINTCHHMLESAKNIFSLDPRYYIKYCVDQKVWKAAVYDIISITRQRDQKLPANINSVQETASITIIEMGCNHFKDLIEAAQSGFKMDLKPVLKKYGFLSDLDSENKSAVELLYKFFIYIGDLNRYGLAIKPSRSYCQIAYEYYEMARLCDVQKGRAFNQLGIISTLRRDTFGIAYNFTRAYIAPVPAEGSRLQLLDVYDQMYKEHLKVKDQFWYSVSKTPEKNVRWERHFRRQVWLFPRYKKRIDEPPKLEKDTPTKEQHIKSLLPSELYNRFATTYVLFLGKIFTKIGMDTLEEVAEECLVYFDGVLKSNLKMSSVRIAQIAGMIIYIVDSINLNELKLTGQHSQMKYVRTIAVQFLLEIFSIAAERLLNLTLLSDWENPQIAFLSMALMLWCDWLKKNRSDWVLPHCRPRFCTRRLEKSRYKNKKDLEDDVWIIFAKLMTRLEVILNRVNQYIFPSVSKTKSEDCSIPLSPLPEVIVLSGFSSCMSGSLYKTQFFYGGRYSETRAQVFVRLNAVRGFGSEYVTKRYGLLSRTKGFYNAYQYKSEVKLLPSKNLSDSCGLDERHFLYWAGELFNKEKKFKILRPDCNSARVILRNKTKAVRNSPLPCPKLKVHDIWFLLGERGFHSDIVVNPLRIILDTNCFIQRFECVKKLRQYFPYPIILPVSVVLELKGLSKGGLRTRYKERFSNLDCPEALEKLRQGNETAETCKMALEFINSNMKDFQVVTTVGRVLKINSIYERIQDDFYNPKERNDDRILDTCRYIEGYDKELRARDTHRRIFRNTVLITGDRCLRIRTYVLDIPARDISCFLIWAARYYHRPTPEASPFRGRRRFNGKKRF